MERIRPALTLDDVNSYTYWAAREVGDHRKALENFDSDAHKERREQAHECRRCFYLRDGRMAGQAFTDWNCGVCNKVSSNPNTATPRVCMECAKKYRLCTECAGDYKEIQGRKKLCLGE